MIWEADDRDSWTLWVGDEYAAVLMRSYPERRAYTGASSAYAKDRTKPMQWAYYLKGQPTKPLRNVKNLRHAKKLVESGL